MTMRPNQGKKLYAQIGGKKFARFPIKTRLITDADDLSQLVDQYTKKQRKAGDIIVVSEKIVAITQGRSIPLSSITPSWWARQLYKFVYDHPGGIGLRSPYTMKLAIGEAGLGRILLAALISVLTKPLGMKGMFYRVAGASINAIDGPTPYSLPPSDKSAKLPPKNPGKVAQQLEKKLGLGVIIIDANDYGVNVLGTSDIADSADLPIKLIFADNPMGQAREQTPIVIMRKIKE